MKTLDSAGDIDTSPAVQRGLREGVNLIKNAGKSNLSQRNKVRTGNLKRSFTIKVTRRKKIGRNYALAGFKKSAPNKGIKGANHSYLVDKGHRKRNGKGWVQGSFFHTDAVQTEGPRALNNLVSVIQSELKRMMG